VLAVAGYLPPHPSQRFTAAGLLLVSFILMTWRRDESGYAVGSESILTQHKETSNQAFPLAVLI
jgi:hypothetical protein